MSRFENGVARALAFINERVDVFGEKIPAKATGTAKTLFHTTSGYILEQDGPVYYLYHGTKLIASGSDRKKVVDHMPMGTKGAGIY